MFIDSFLCDSILFFASGYAHAKAIAIVLSNTFRFYYSEKKNGIFFLPRVLQLTAFFEFN